MQLNFIKPKENIATAKLTVHKSGKIGLSKGAADLLQVEKLKFCKFGTNETSEMFVVMFGDSDDETFNIAKAGAYYYISAKVLLKDIGIDYKSNDTIIFDLEETENENVYKMIKRIIKK